VPRNSAHASPAAERDEDGVAAEHADEAVRKDLEMQAGAQLTFDETRQA
jgi:hypothetical protein